MDLPAVVGEARSGECGVSVEIRRKRFIYKTYSSWRLFLLETKAVKRHPCLMLCPIVDIRRPTPDYVSAPLMAVFPFADSLCLLAFLAPRLEARGACPAEAPVPVPPCSHRR